VSLLHSLSVFAVESGGHSEAAEHASEEASGIAALGIDPIAILVQAGTFLILFWIIKKFALDSIVNTLEERRKTIDNGVRLGRKMEEEEARLEQKIDKELQRTRAESDKIIASAYKESGEIVQAAQDQASEKVDQMIADAHAKISEDMNKAKQALEKEMRSLVAEATEVIIEEKLDQTKDETLIQKALRTVGVGQ